MNRELRALLGHSPFWGSRRLIAAVVLTALGVVVVGAFVALGRAVHVRAWPVAAAAFAAAALASLVLARGTTGVINDVLVMASAARSATYCGSG